MVREVGREAEAKTKVPGWAQGGERLQLGGAPELSLARASQLTGDRTEEVVGKGVGTAGS